MVEPACAAVFFDDGAIWARWTDGASTKVVDLPTGWSPARFLLALSASAQSVDAAEAETLQSAPADPSGDVLHPVVVAAHTNDPVLSAAFAALSRQVDRLSVEVRLRGLASVDNHYALVAEAFATVVAAVQVQRAVGLGRRGG